MLDAFTFTYRYIMHRKNYQKTSKHKHVLVIIHDTLEVEPG